ncbi:MAG: replication initiator protein A, partial [Lachnospiraceae bacterium]|nr:replication initiator protein A [Lachnospiraceae bacterium]
MTITTRLPRYLPYAEFLLSMDLSLTAKLVYTMLLDRTTLSQKNGWADEDGNVYIYYALDHIASDTG